MDQRKLSEAEILWEISLETFRVNVGEALAASTSVQDFISFIAKPCLLALPLIISIGISSSQIDNTKTEAGIYWTNCFLEDVSGKNEMPVEHAGRKDLPKAFTDNIKSFVPHTKLRFTSFCRNTRLFPPRELENYLEASSSSSKDEIEGPFSSTAAKQAGADLRKVRVRNLRQ
ncbi:uncharacterized protein RSE6_03936 [Rhynchosporium secalis]|uniref:Uncharacterized protein n=1 Tax=Rhynchosporium secalis TaxID=38038 RepID=A0A1E1M401_RHYSE|nr:uncharacterized protein RSE6_03936 [Rhynchosporium secalis]